ncbi:DUF1796 family putative cysteine peptidase [Brachyspira aalborgi]|uniref:Cysteine protease n=1 Tax=Brachyspira aalborgi TaxID=29522 RepID=A0A5C8EQB5_9SPIR|nr:DUF1796 family putative cysteine peptidase [Brachyspira aalborgi]TXJ39578.1 cysteine protease [Brachyspira aalborgi]
MYSKAIDKIVWWIPFKNLRNLIRVILINISEINEIKQELNNIKSQKDNTTRLYQFCNNSNKMLDNNIYEYDFIFSIGENCFCADILNKNNLRTTSSPFDWLTPNRDYSKTNMISNLQIINNKFKDFLIKDNFIYIGDSVKDGVKMYLNNNAKLFHNHDFFIGNEFEEDYIKIKDTYLKRIERLLNELKSDKKILMAYIEHYKLYNNDFYINELIDLLNAIRKTYNNENIDLLYIRHEFYCNDITFKIIDNKIHLYILDNSFDYTKSYDKGYTPHWTGNAWATSEILNRYKLK